MRVLSVSIAILFSFLWAMTGRAQDEKELSGPQVGEELANFEVRDLLSEDSEAKFDPVAIAEKKPILLVFVHEMNRPTVGMLRVLLTYAGKLGSEKVVPSGVFLTADSNETLEWAKRAQHALPKGVRLGVSTEGIEGPGAYGLNRKVAMTILIAKENKVVANYALIQPSLNVDAIEIAKKLAATVGVEEPKELKDLVPEMAQEVSDDFVRGLVGPVIRRDASEEDVRKAAEQVEKTCGENPAFRKRMGEIANRIIDAGKLQDYGTPTAQEYLKKWAKEYGAK